MPQSLKHAGSLLLSREWEWRVPRHLSVSHLYVIASLLPVSLLRVWMVLSSVLNEGWPDFFCTDCTHRARARQWRQQHRRGSSGARARQRRQQHRGVSTLSSRPGTRATKREVWRLPHTHWHHCTRHRLLRSSQQARSRPQRHHQHTQHTQSGGLCRLAVLLISKSSRACFFLLPFPVSLNVFTLSLDYSCDL